MRNRRNRICDFYRTGILIPEFLGLLGLPPAWPTTPERTGVSSSWKTDRMTGSRLLGLLQLHHRLAKRIYWSVNVSRFCPKPKLLISYRYSYICHHKALVHFTFPFLIFFLQFLLASSWDKHVRLYDVVNNNLRVKYAHQHPVLCCAFQVRTVCRSTNLKASLWFWTKDAAEPRQMHRPLQCWFPMILQPKEAVFHDLLCLPFT